MKILYIYIYLATGLKYKQYHDFIKLYCVPLLNQWINQCLILKIFSFITFVMSYKYIKSHVRFGTQSDKKEEKTRIKTV